MLNTGKTRNVRVDVSFINRFPLYAFNVSLAWVLFWVLLIFNLIRKPKESEFQSVTMAMYMFYIDWATDQFSKRVASMITVKCGHTERCVWVLSTTSGIFYSNDQVFNTAHAPLSCANLFISHQLWEQFKLNLAVCAMSHV